MVNISKNMKKNKIKVVMLSAEVAPFAKVGGLADVGGSLPPAMQKLGVDVRMIMPLYGSIDRKKFKLKQIASQVEVPSDRGLTKIDIFKSVLPGTTVPVYFIDSPHFFKFHKIYTSADNARRFLFYSYAALYITPVIDFKPDLVHCHDSHVALVPDILKVTNFEFLKGIKTIYTIHNFSYQGKTGVGTLSTGNLSKNALQSLTVDAANGDINFTVQGVLNADIVNTVSPTYSHEILTKYYGEGLDKIIKKRKKDLYGIVNGIDTKAFDPSTDKMIVQKYSAKTLDRKIKNKVALQKRLGLTVDPKIAMVGLVSRLVVQKGLDLISEKFADLNCQYVFLGTGSPEIEKKLKIFGSKNRKKVSANIMFDGQLAQQIYAGSDIFIMPSLFEPCGLGQMIAMRYGTVPVVRATGGLDDTVDSKVGFKFAEMKTDAFYSSLKKALNVYYNNPAKWKQLQIDGMKRDFSWNKSAREYLKLYKKLLEK